MPGSLSQTHAEIAACAHAIWLAEGKPDGRSAEHWRQAELQLHLAQVHERQLKKSARTRDLPVIEFVPARSTQDRELAAAAS